MPSYQIIRTDRKSIAIQIKPDGQVVVRCPKHMRSEDVKRFVERKSAWILKHMKGKTGTTEPKFTSGEVQQLREQARKLVTARVQHFAPVIGVGYNRIAIRTQRTLWGSCSSKGNLNFNCLLALVPTDVLDYVVVHELCHRKEMNHSERFWKEVGQIIPDYNSCRKWLKDHGDLLFARL